MSDNCSAGLHSCTILTMASSAVALYIYKGSNPNSWGETLRDNPSNTVFRTPGTCSASARFAFRCIDIVVKIMLLYELTPSLPYPTLPMLTNFCCRHVNHNENLTTLPAKPITNWNRCRQWKVTVTRCRWPSDYSSLHKVRPPSPWAMRRTVWWTELDAVEKIPRVWITEMGWQWVRAQMLATSLHLIEL